MSALKFQAIKELGVESGFSVDDSGNVTWHAEPDSKPTDAQIEAKYQELKTAHTNSKYARKRVVQYPDIGDQLDDLYKKGAFSAEMTAKIKAVKDANPKPS